MFNISYDLLHIINTIYCTLILIIVVVIVITNTTVITFFIIGVSIFIAVLVFVVTVFTIFITPINRKMTATRFTWVSNILRWWC